MLLFLAHRDIVYYSDTGRYRTTS